MKKGIVALEGKEKVTQELVDSINSLAKKMDVKVENVIYYQEGAILEAPDTFINTLKFCEADYVFVQNTEFPIAEIQTGELSKALKEVNMEMVDIHSGLELTEFIEILPENFKKGVRLTINIAKDMQNTSKMKKNPHNETSALVFAKDATSTEVEKYAEQVSKLGYKKIGVVQIDKHFAGFAETLENVVSGWDIDSVYLYDEYDSQEFAEFFDTLSQKGVDVIKREQTNETILFNSMRMN